jgi:hypothetical protein
VKDDQTQHPLGMADSLKSKQWKLFAGVTALKRMSDRTPRLPVALDQRATRGRLKQPQRARRHRSSGGTQAVETVCAGRGVGVSELEYSG